MDKCRKALKLQDIFVYIPVWKIGIDFHGYPQEKTFRYFSTGCVNNKMFIMWITSWIMWIEYAILRHVIFAVIFLR